MLKKFDRREFEVYFSSPRYLKKQQWAINHLNSLGTVQLRMICTVPSEFKLKDIVMLLFSLIKNARKNKVETAAEFLSISDTKERLHLQIKCAY